MAQWPINPLILFYNYHNMASCPFNLFKLSKPWHSGSNGHMRVVYQFPIKSWLAALSTFLILIVKIIINHHHYHHDNQSSISDIIPGLYW